MMLINKILKLIIHKWHTLAQKDAWTGSRSKTGIVGKDCMEDG